MNSDKNKYKIDKSVLISNEISVEQDLLELITYGESRDSSLVKAEKIIKCLFESSHNQNDLFNKLNEVIKINPIGPMTLFAILLKFGEIEVSHRATLMVNMKLENDPKQIALKEIENYYNENRNQFKRRGFSAQFIREMHSKYPIITEQKTIANLVTRLNKENELIPR